MFKAVVDFIKGEYANWEMIPLHAPLFMGKEREYVLNTIESSYVSSVGPYVSQFEQNIANYTHSPSAIATMNGTSALHMSLLLAGVCSQDYVLTQALTFVATANAISYCQAEPIFIDVDEDTLGLSAKALAFWLEEHAYVDEEGLCRHRDNKRIIRACLPMHTFGHPVHLDELLAVTQTWHLTLIEDAAEALGSLYKGRHVGTLGSLGVISFNGNKIITTGGGGMILSNKELGQRAKHLTTTAKTPHAYEFYHDELAYNYRMPNLNAALGCAQLEMMEHFIEHKRQLAARYEAFFTDIGLKFVKEPKDCRSNYWLNAIVCADSSERDAFLQATNQANILTRPIWQTLDTLPMYQQSLRGSLTTTKWLAERVVNLPSSVCLGENDA